MQPRQPRMRSLNISPSRVYAPSPYRPTAIFGTQYDNYINQLNQTILRATSPFQISDKATLDHIRRYEGIDSGSSFDSIGIAGGLIGAGIATAAVTSAYLSAAFAQAAAGIGTTVAGGAATATGAGAGAGIPTMIKGVATTISAIGTIIMGYTIGKTVTQGIFTPEGRHFMGAYLGNLGSSMVARPITTVMNLSTIAAMEVAKAKIPFLKRTPHSVTTLSFMSLNWATNSLGGYVDNKIFGPVTEYQAISYTTLGAIRGDILDMQDGNPILRGAILGITGGDDVIEKIGSAYGLTDEYDDFLAGDLRNNWGIDLGHFGNSVVDMIGEMVIDTSYIGRAAENSLANKIGIGKTSELYQYGKENPDSEIGRMFYKKKKNKVFEDGEIKIEEELSSIRESKKPKTEEEFKTKSNEILSKSTVAELKKIAKEYDIKLKSRLRKKEIIEEITKTKSEDVVNKNLDLEEQTLRTEKLEELRKIQPVEWEYEDTELSIGLQKNKRLHRLFQEYYKDYIPETAARNPKQLEKIKKANEELLLKLTSNFTISVGDRESYNLLLQAELMEFLRRDQVILEVKNKKIEISEDSNFVIKDLGTKKDNSYFSKKGYSFDAMVADTAIEKGYKASQLLNERYLNKFSSYRFMNETNDKITKYTTTLVDLPRTFSRMFLQSRMNKIARRITENDEREMQITLEKFKQLGINSEEYKKEVKILQDAYSKTLEASWERVDELIQNENTLGLKTKIEEINKKLKALETLDQEKNKEEFEKLQEELKTLTENYNEQREKTFNDLFKKDANFREFYIIYKREKDRITALENERKRYKNINVKVKYNFKVKTEDNLFTMIKSINKDNVKYVEKLMDDLKNKKDGQGLSGQEELELKELQTKYFKYKVAEGFADQKVEISNRLFNIQVLASERELTFSRAIFTIRSQTRKIMMYSNNSIITEMSVEQYREAVEYQRLRANKSRTEQENNRMIELKNNLGEDTINEIDNLDNEVVELLNKTSRKTEYTQDDIIENAEQRAKLFGSRKILSMAVEDQINGQLVGVLGKEMGERLEQKIRNNEEVSLKLSYAVEFLSAINPLVFGDANSATRFVMNDYEFSRFLEPRITENEIINNSLNILGRLIDKIENPIGGKSQYQYKNNDKKRVSQEMEILKREVLKILDEASKEEDPYGKPLLSEPEVNNIKSQIDTLLYSLVGTHQTMKFSKTGHGTRSKKVSQLTSAELNHWLHQEYMSGDNPGYEATTKYLNDELRLLNKGLVDLKESFDGQDEGIGKYVPEQMRTDFLRRQTYNIFGSRFLSGLSYDFTKTNMFVDYTGKKIRPYETKAIPLDENHINELNKNFEGVEIKERKFTKEGFKDDLVQEAFAFNNPDNLRALGITEDDIQEAFKSNLESITEIEDIKKTVQFFGDETIRLFEEQKTSEGITDEDIELLDKEINEFKLLLKEYETMLIKKQQTDHIVKQTEEAEKRSSEISDDTPLFKWLKGTSISKKLIIANMHNIIRGDAVKKSGHISFDFNNSTSRKVVEDFLTKNEVPTLEAITQLLDNEVFAFTDMSGGSVRLTSLSQLKRSGILAGTLWENYLYDDKIIEVKNELVEVDGKFVYKSTPQKDDKGNYIYIDIASRDKNGNLIITEREFSFYKGIDIEVLKQSKELFEAMVDSSYRIPAKIRENIYKEEIEFKNINDIENYENLKGTIVDDFYKSMLSAITEDYADAKIEVSDVNSIEIGGFNNKFRVMRIYINKEEYFDMYIPEAEEVKVSEDGSFRLGNVYEAMGQRYVKVDRISEPTKDADYVKYLVDSLMFDIKTNYANHKAVNTEERFQPRLSQKNMYNIFFDQRFSESGLDNELVTDFIRIDDKSGIYQELILGHQARINDSFSDISKKNGDYFEKLILEEKISYGDKEYSVYDLRSTTQNPKSVFKTVEGVIGLGADGKEIIGRYSLNDLVLPFNLNQGIASRSSIPLNALKMQKTLYITDNKGNVRERKEEALVQTNLQKLNNKQFKDYLNGGINLDSYVQDVSYSYINERGEKIGFSTFEDGAIMPRSMASNYFGIDEGSSGFKIINRHSGKQSVKIVPDDIFRKALGLSETDSMPDIVYGKSSIKRRELINLISEITLTQGVKRNEDGTFNTSDIKYVDNHKSLEENGVTLSSETNRGFVYSYLTDYVDFGPDQEGHKTAGADGKEGAVFGVEEIVTVSGLRDITDSEGKSLDPNGELFDYFIKEASTSNMDELETSLSVNINSTDLTGKPGLIKKDLMRRQLRHSGYNVILPDSSLKANEMKIPISQAIKAEILVETKEEESQFTYNDKHYKFVNDSAKEGVVLRYPTTGRRSMIHINFVIDESENKAAFLSLGLHKLLNADHDGDRVAFLSHANANDHILKLSRKAFGHNYDTKGSSRPFSDNAFQGEGFEQEVSTSRDPDEVFAKDAGMESYIDEEGITRFRYTEDEIESYNNFIKNGNDIKVTEEEARQSFSKQKNLKEYAGLITGLVDSQLMMYEQDNVGRNWFKKTASTDDMKRPWNSFEAHSKLQEMKIYDFPSFGAYLKDTYSQLTFDFLKHGKEEQRISFQNLVDNARRDPQRLETFEMHIKRLIDVAYLDFKAMQNLKESVDGINKELSYEEQLKLEKEYLELYRKRLQQGRMNVQEDSTEESIYEKHRKIAQAYKESLTKEQAQKMLDANRSSEVLTQNNNAHKTQGNEVEEKFNEFVKKHNLEKIKEDSEEKSKSTETFEHINNVGYDMKWNTGREEDERQIFRFLSERVGHSMNKIGRERLDGTELYALPNKIKKQLFKMIDEIPNIASNIHRYYFTTIINGEIRRIPLASLFSIKVGDKFEEITNATFGGNLDITNRKNAQIYVDVVNKMRLFDEGLQTFFIETTEDALGHRALDSDKNEEYNKQLFYQIDEAVTEILEKIGIDKRAIVTPALHGSFSFRVGVFKDLMVGLNNLETEDFETNSPSVIALRTLFNVNQSYKENPEDERINNEIDIMIEDLLGALTPHFAYQVFSEMLDPDNPKINNVKRLIFEQGLFAEPLTEKRYENDQEILDILNKYKLLRGLNVTELANKFIEATSEFYKKQSGSEIDNRTEKDALNQLITIAEQIQSATSQSLYNAQNDFFQHSDFDTVLRYITQIQNIKWGAMTGNQTIYNFDEDRLKSISGSSSIEEVDKRIINLHLRRLVNIMSNTSIKNGPQISDAIDGELLDFNEIGESIRELNSKLRRYNTNEELLKNKVITNGSTIEKVAPFLGYNNMDDTRIFMKSSKEEKTVRTIIEELYSSLFTKRDIEGPQSEIARELFEINQRDPRTRENILALYTLTSNRDGTSNDLRTYIKRLEDALKEQSTILEGLPINQRTFEYILNLNKLLLQIDPTLSPILPDTIKTIKNDLARDVSFGDFYYDEVDQHKFISHKNISNHNIYATYFRGLIISKEGQVGYEELITARDTLNTFITLNQNINTGGIAPIDFVDIIFGKILYEEQMAKINLYEVEPKKRIENAKKFRGSILKLIKDIDDIDANKMFKDSMQITNEVIDLSLETDEDNLTNIITNYLKGDNESQELVTPEQINIVKRGIKKYKTEKERQITKVQIDEAADSMSAARSFIFGEDGPVIKTFALRNIHHQLATWFKKNNIDLGISTNEDSSELAKLIEKKYRNILKANEVNVKNPNFHTAMIDVLINHEVMLMFSEYANQNPKALDNYKKDSKIRKFYENYRDANERKNLILFDNETLIGNSNNTDNKNRVYEISYISFDENGLPKYNQKFIYNILDPITKNWLMEEKGFTEEEIINIENEMKKDLGWNQKRNTIESFLDEAKGKQIFGQNIEGDIEQINNEHERIIKNDVSKILTELKIDSDDVIKAIPTANAKELQTLYESYLKHEFKNDSKFINSFLEAMNESIVQRFRTEYMYGSQVSYTEREKQAYSAKMEALLNVFSNSLITDDNLLVEMKKVLTQYFNENAQIEDSVLLEIIKSYRKAYDSLKAFGSFVFEVPEFSLNEEYGTIQFKSLDGQGILSVEDDGTLFSEVMFRQQALYNIMPLLKEAIVYGGMNYKQHEQLAYNQKLLSTENNKLANTLRNSQNERVRAHLKNYESNLIDNPIEALMDIKKALSLHKEDTNVKLWGLEKFMTNEHDKIDTEMLKSIDQDMRLEDKESVKRLINTSQSDLEKMINRYINNIIANQFGDDPENRNRYTKFYETSWNFYKAGSNLITLSPDGTPDANRQLFDSLLGLDSTSDKDLSDELFEKFVNNYQRFVEQGLPFQTRTNNLTKLVEHNNEIDRMFIQMAFTAIAGDRSGIGKYLHKHLDDNFKFETNEFGEYEERNIYRKEQRAAAEDLFEPIRTLVKNTTQENEFNKSYFTNERFNLKNKILKGMFYGDWSELDAYLKASPKLRDNPDQEIQDFKNLFINKYNQLIKDGIYIYEDNIHVDSNGSLQFSKQTERKINFKPNNNSIKMHFIKEAMKEFWLEIDNELYINKYRSTEDLEKDISEPLLRSEYIQNIKKYGGYRIQSSLALEQKNNKVLQDGNQALYERKNRIDQLSKYQSNFNDIMDMFRNPKTGELNVRAFYEAYKNGFLGKTYRITAITEVSRKQVEDSPEAFNNQKQFGVFKNDQEVLESYGDEGIKILEKLQNSGSPVIKQLNIDSFEEFENLIRIAESGEFLGLGFSTLNQLIKANRISYKDYALPKPLANIERSLVRMQKFLVTTSPSFFVKMIYDDLAKNYNAILGNDAPLYNNYRFAKEAIKAMQLGLHYTSFNKDIKSNMILFEDFFKNFSDINPESYSADNFKGHKKFMNDFLEDKISNLRLFKQNFVENDFNSKLYKQTTQLENNLSMIKLGLDSLDNITNFEAVYNQIKSIAVDLFQTYHYSDFTSKVIMNSNSKSSIDIAKTDLSQEDKNTLLDTINLVGLINKAEESKLFYTPFELNGGMEAYDIYKIINNVSKEVVSNGLIANFVDWTVFDSPIGKPRKKLLNMISKHSAIHGLLLDRYVNHMSDDEAIAAGLHRFFNYNMQSPFEKEAAALFPFIGFALRNLDYQMELMTDPKHIRFMANLHQGMQSFYRRDDEDDETQSNWYHMMVENQGWIPMGKDWGIKLGNPMHQAINLIDNPYEGAQMYQNSLISGIQSVIKGQGFDPSWHGSMGSIISGAKGINNIVTGQVNRPADILPGLFYTERPSQKYTPRNYRVNYDYRNLNKQLFFTDGSRRTPSKNPYTTAKNIRYQALVNASINRRRR